MEKPYQGIAKQSCLRLCKRPLMLWFWLSAFVVLFGAELNSEMERQTCHDTTVGEARPLGEREAFAADTIGVENPWNSDNTARK